MVIASAPLGAISHSPAAMSQAPPGIDDSHRDGVDPDVSLMRRVQAGDMGAFEELVETHQARVVGTIAKMLGDDMDSEDLAQQVFLRVWKSASRYEPNAKFTTWLFTITRNLVFNEIRRRKRHPVSSLERTEDDRPALDPEDHTMQGPAHSLLDQELQEAIQRAIDSLPEAQRMAIILRRFENMPYEEIAEVLELTVPAVKSVLFRARTELRERLRDYLEG